MNLISVIIPTYNRADTICRAVNSVLNQTYNYLECIIVDDASQDNTANLITSINDSRLKYLFHDKNKNASAARNTGLSAANGEYISFLDSDDEWTPTKLEKQYNLLTSLPEEYGMVYCWFNYYRNGQILIKKEPVLEGNIFNNIIGRIGIAAVDSYLIKKEVINRLGGFDENLINGDDTEFFLKVAKYYKIGLIRETLVKVHFDPEIDHLSANTNEGMMDKIKSDLYIIKKYNNDFLSNKMAKLLLFSRIARNYSLLGKWDEFLKYSFLSIKQNPFILGNYKFLLKSLLKK